MKQYTFTFNGTDEQILAGAVENGYTGFKPKVPSDEIIAPNPEEPTAPVEPEPETLDEFMCRILMTVSPNDFIRIATNGLQGKLGSENYDAQAMTDAMLNLITIEPVE